MPAADINLSYFKRGDDLATYLDALPKGARQTRALRAWAAALAADADRLLTLAEALDAVPTLRGKPGFRLEGDTHSATVDAEDNVILALADAGLVTPVNFDEDEL